MYQAEGSFEGCQMMTGAALLRAPEVRVPEWQSLDVKDKPMGVTYEIQNAVIEVPIPNHPDDVVTEVKPNMPWAEEHFLERVSGAPLNPPPSHRNWPFAQSGNKDHLADEKFSHTYPERMWPKKAGDLQRGGPGFGTPDNQHGLGYGLGIRFSYGDLMDVADQLRKSPLTRQAYLPIWFPEDTGAVHGERVPCSLGYHFLIREGQLNVTYFIRSCDFIRHFPDDVYMAMRLGQWIRDEVNKRNQGIASVSENAPFPSKPAPVLMGNLNMHMVSLHIFGGDLPRMRELYGHL